MNFAVIPCSGVSVQSSPAVSDEGNLLRIRAEQLLADYYKPISTRWMSPAIRFLDLKEKWEIETGMLSSITEIAMHPSYQQIIGIGPVAIPLILKEMSERPNYWFWALKAITGEDPIDPQSRGNIAAMTEDWLNWGRTQRYFA